MLLAIPAFAVDIPASSVPVPLLPGLGLYGQIWQAVDGNGDPVAMNWSNFAQVKADLNVDGRAPDATFIGGLIDYGSGSGNLIADWLGADAASLSPKGFGSRQLRGAYIRLQGSLAIPDTYNTIALPNQSLVFAITSDDGMRLTIGNEVVAEYDGPRGVDTDTTLVVFGGPGLYPITLEYFNGLDDGAVLKLGWDILQDQNYAAVPTSLLYPAPEPANWTLVLAGIGLLAIGVRRR
ncbi:MAG: PEP-CTERM sorting domain-containing protein [Acidobacteria bacterium]|nr:PEP-CTERM sorting domain-containing protein [Acidobacteriota bacterium]